jgi:hypothetical protein
MLLIFFGGTVFGFGFVTIPSPAFSLAFGSAKVLKGMVSRAGLGNGSSSNLP